MELNLVGEVLDGLTQRARTFVGSHGVRAAVPDVEQYRTRWLELGIPEAEIDRAAGFQRRWGGLVLPPASEYEGGPLYFAVDTPDDLPAKTPDGATVHGWWFEAGPQRSAVPYMYMIGPSGEFGIRARRWVPLHASVEGWIESLALACHATMWATQITKVAGEMVDGLDLESLEPVAEVQGLTNTWWRSADSLVAVYGGESECAGAATFRTAWVYSGLDDWHLRHG